MGSIGAACFVSTLAAASAIWGAACGTRGQTGLSTPTASATTPVAEGVALAASRAPSPTEAPAKEEVQLVAGMVEHQLMAVMMGEWCLEKAVHDELRSLCESLMAAQGAEVQALQSRQERYRGAREPELTPGMGRLMARLSAVRGADFEVELMRAMLRHDVQGATEARACVEGVHDQELTRLCQDAASTQLAAAAQVRTWLCAWYGRCNL